MSDLTVVKVMIFVGILSMVMYDRFPSKTYYFIRTIKKMFNYICVASCRHGRNTLYRLITIKTSIGASAAEACGVLIVKKLNKMYSFKASWCLLSICLIYDRQGPYFCTPVRYSLKKIGVLMKKKC